jgi:hypothetical protein
MLKRPVKNIIKEFLDLMESSYMLTNEELQLSLSCAIEEAIRLSIPEAIELADAFQNIKVPYKYNTFITEFKENLIKSLKDRYENGTPKEKALLLSNILK